MDILNSIFSGSATTSENIGSISEIILVIFGTFLLAIFIAFVYKKTYSGKFYNPSFVQTLIILPVLIAIVMMIVGENAAGAFTLMGALSIVRFRNSLKDIRDIGFILFAIAIGMAMGTKLFLFAILGTISVSVIFWILFHFSLFQNEIRITKILKIRLDSSRDFRHIFDKIFAEKNLQTEFLSVVPIIESNLATWESLYKNEISYKISHTENFDYKNFIDEIEKITQNKNIFILEN